MAAGRRVGCKQLKVGKGNKQIEITNKKENACIPNNQGIAH
jgi:hypothetical protein